MNREIITPLTLDFVVEKKLSGIDCVRYFKPEWTDENCNDYLWNSTCFPFSVTELIKQLNSNFINQCSTQHLDLTDVRSTDKFFKQFDPSNNKDDLAKLRIMKWHILYLENLIGDVDEELVGMIGLSDVMKAHIREMFGNVKFQDDGDEHED